nr:putative ribonuclease H-like domain-containing protein [Tanacetum cinerariifolium]
MQQYKVFSSGNSAITLDYLGKFNGKADEGFLVGYSVNSKEFRVFNSWTRKVEENMHVNFLENKPNVAGSGPEWLFDIESLTKSMNYEPVSARNQFNGDAAIQSSDVNAGDQPGDVNAGDIQGDEKLRNDDVCQGNEIIIDSSTHAVNVASISINTASNIIVAGSLNINTVDSNHTNMPTLEATGIFDGPFNDRDLGAKANINNLDSSTIISPIPTTRALKDPSWIEAMQEELFLFKLQDVWTLVDLPYEKRAIGSKWVFKNKLNERGNLQLVDVNSLAVDLSLGSVKSRQWLQTSQLRLSMLLLRVAMDRYSGYIINYLITDSGCKLSTEAEYVAALSCYGQVPLFPKDSPCPWEY